MVPNPTCNDLVESKSSYFSVRPTMETINKKYESSDISHSQKEMLSTQTGKLLIIFGHILGNLPNGSQRLEEHTSEKLIFIGKKLIKSPDQT